MNAGSSLVASDEQVGFVRGGQQISYQPPQANLRSDAVVLFFTTRHHSFSGSPADGPVLINHNRSYIFLQNVPFVDQTANNV